MTAFAPALCAALALLWLSLKWLGRAPAAQAELARVAVFALCVSGLAACTLGLGAPGSAAPLRQLPLAQGIVVLGAGITLWTELSPQLSFGRVLRFVWLALGAALLLAARHWALYVLAVFALRVGLSTPLPRGVLGVRSLLQLGALTAGALLLAEGAGSAQIAALSQAAWSGPLSIGLGLSIGGLFAFALEAATAAAGARDDTGGAALSRGALERLPAVAALLWLGLVLPRAFPDGAASAPWAGFPGALRVGGVGLLLLSGVGAASLRSAAARDGYLAAAPLGFALLALAALPAGALASAAGSALYGQVAASLLSGALLAGGRRVGAGGGGTSFVALGALSAVGAPMTVGFWPRLLSLTGESAYAQPLLLVLIALSWGLSALGALAAVSSLWQPAPEAATRADASARSGSAPALRLGLSLAAALALLLWVWPLP